MEKAIFKYTLSSKPLNINTTYYPESDLFHLENYDTATSSFLVSVFSNYIDSFSLSWFKYKWITLKIAVNIIILIQVDRLIFMELMI